MITYQYGNCLAPAVLIQMVGEHDLPGIEKEIREIRKRTEQDFELVAVKVNNWNHDLSQWRCLEKKILAMVRQRRWKKC